MFMALMSFFQFFEQCIHVMLVGFMPTVYILATCKRLFEVFVVLINLINGG